MKAPTLLIIDSGVGGLSIAQEVRQLVPNSQYFYVADNAAFPYGILTEEALVRRLLQLIPPLVTKLVPDLVIVACNTASTAALAALREVVTVPVVGVVPAIKPAAISSKSKQIALLATPGTISSPYTDNLIRQFAQGCQVMKLASNALVLQAEKKLQGESINLEDIARELSPLLEKSILIDTLVLGCTHFPLLKGEMAAVLPDSIELMDSGAAIAKRAQQLLPPNTNNLVNEHLNYFFYTKETDIVDKIRPQLKGFGFEELQFLNVEFQQITQKSSAS